MRKSDLARSAFGGLWRQKARTMLTLTGVIVGTCSFAFSLSLGVGLRKMIDREFQKRDEFWWVHAHSPRRGTTKEDDSDIPAHEIAVEGSLSAETAERFRQQKILEYRRRTPPKELKLITPELVERMRAIPDVEEIRIFRNAFGMGTLDGRNEQGFIAATRLDIYDPPLESRLQAGRMPVDLANECLVSDYFLYKLGIRDAAGMAAVVGQPLRLTVGEQDHQKGFSLASVLGPANPIEMVSAAQAEILGKVVRQFPEKLEAFDLTPDEKAAVRAALTRKSAPPPKKTPTARATFTVVGVIRLTSKEERPAIPNPSKITGGSQDIQLSDEGGDRLFAQLTESVERGYPDVHVRCRPNGNLRGVVEAVEALGIEQYSTLKWYESAKLEVTLISVGLNVFSVIALFIAGIGITNTLITTVLERTREIGILKAVGAKDGDVTLLFLAEGMVVGLLGGTLGIAAARLIAGPADELVYNLVKKVSQSNMTSGTVFEFPWWLTGGAVLFAVLVTTLAAWYPARRAARIEPVDALRHE